MSILKLDENIGNFILYIRTVLNGLPKNDLASMKQVLYIYIFLCAGKEDFSNGMLYKLYLLLAIHYKI